MNDQDWLLTRRLLLFSRQFVKLSEQASKQFDEFMGLDEFELALYVLEHGETETKQD